MTEREHEIDATLEGCVLVGLPNGPNGSSFYFNAAERSYWIRKPNGTVDRMPRMWGWDAVSEEAEEDDDSDWIWSDTDEDTKR